VGIINKITNPTQSDIQLLQENTPNFILIIVISILSIIVIILISIIIGICRKIFTNHNNSNSPEIDEQNQDISTYIITNVNEDIDSSEFVSD